MSLSTARRPRLLLGLGALVGITLAAAGLFRGAASPRGNLPQEAVARVNDRIISRQDYERAVDALRRDKRNLLTEKDRRFGTSQAVSRGRERQGNLHS